MILTNRMMYGVEAQPAQQRRRLHIAALHVQRRPFTAFLIILRSLSNSPATPATFAAAHHRGAHHTPNAPAVLALPDRAARAA